jgi:hypothetical protein
MEVSNFGRERCERQRSVPSDISHPHSEETKMSHSFRSKSKLMSLAFCLICHTSFAASSTAPGELDASEFRNLVQQRANAIKGVHVVLKYAMRWGDKDNVSAWMAKPPRSEFLIDAKMSANGIRLTRAPTSKPVQSEEVAWNGSKDMERSYSPDDPSMVQGSITTSPGAIIQSSYWATLFGYQFFEDSLTLAAALDPAKCQMLGRKRIGTSDAFGIKRTAPGVIQEVWVDPVRGFAPLELSQALVNDAGKTISMLRIAVDDLKQIGGVWIPMKADITVVSDNEPTELNCYSIEVLSAEAGLDLPATAFVIEYPEGARVWDNIAKLSYVVGEGVVVRDSDGRSVMVPQADTRAPAVVQTETGAAFKRAEYIIAVLAVLGLLVAAAYAMHRWRGQP